VECICAEEERALNWTVEFLLVAAVAILPSAAGSLFAALRPDAALRRLEATDPFQISLLRFLHSIAGIAIVLLVALGQPNDLDSIGLRLGRPAALADALLTSLLIVVSILAGVLIVTLLLRSRIKRKETTPSGRLLEFAYQKTRLDRILYATVMPFSAIAEEMTYRGYLVLLFATRTGHLVPWIVLSIGLSITIHLYQGTQLRLILFHSVYAGLMIWLTLYTGGIEGPILIHVTWNTVNFIRAWQTADRAKTEEKTDSARGIMRVGYLLFMTLNLLLLASACCMSVLTFR
jgi:membrane protease YdiL (CAAX protease family)